MKYLFRVFVAVAYVFFSVIIFTIFILISLIWHFEPFRLVEEMEEKRFPDIVDDEFNAVLNIINGTYKVNNEN